MALKRSIARVLSVPSGASLRHQEPPGLRRLRFPSFIQIFKERRIKSTTRLDRLAELSARRRQNETRSGLT
jgi:hypothetical protein